MIRIYKVQLFVGIDQQVDMPQNAHAVHVHEQDGNPCVWFMCDPSLPLVARTLDVVGTGWDIAADRRYIGAAHCGQFVWHVLEHVG